MLSLYDPLVKHWGIAVSLAFWAVACGDLAPEASTPRGDGGKEAANGDRSSNDGASTKADDTGSTDRGSTEAGDTGSTEGASTEADGPSDGRTFACGETFCREDEICFYPACAAECLLPLTAPLPDAGSCPDGSTLADARDTCIIPFTCQPPSCGSPDPENGSFCSGQDGGISGVIYWPVPAGSSHDCYGVCD
jgi:hypothetical protein